MPAVSFKPFIANAVVMELPAGSIPRRTILLAMLVAAATPAVTLTLIPLITAEALEVLAVRECTKFRSMVLVAVEEEV